MSNNDSGIINFSIDAKLLEELGERLVGKHFIALAELIKNGYDADADNVKIEFSKKNNGTIIVEDNGMGMTFDEFRDFWMRIGSKHKKEWKISPIYKRPLTGSKGVGRLSAQLLSDNLEISTVSNKNKKEKIIAKITWSNEISKEELTDTSVFYNIERTDDGKEYPQGTKIIMTKLKQYWSQDDFKKLAIELWELVPPFKGMEPKTGSFEIEFKSDIKYYEMQFKNQMKAFLRNYEWKLSGINENGQVTAYIQHKDGLYENFRYQIHSSPDKGLKNGEFEIRIYRLLGRQKYGLLVDEVRDYLHHNGGIHIYDSGFHLPFYGGEQNDWLGVLHEHARRINYSNLLPKSMQENIVNPMNFLPALQRVLGTVKINTSEEPSLDISITRDRLIESNGFDELRLMIRYALHYYALKETIRQEEEQSYLKTKEILRNYPIEKIEKMENIIDKYDDEIKPKIKEEIKKEIKSTIDLLEKRETDIKKDISFMGALATAGISAIGYQHEIRKHMSTIDYIIEDIDEIALKNKQASTDLLKIKNDLKEWKRKAEGFNAIFQYYMDTDANLERKRYKAITLINDTKNQVKRFGRGILINADEVDENLLLPNASLIEWCSIFQNIYLNAFNAMEDSKIKEIKVISRKKEREREILILDTGCGVDLDSADELFLPFIRKIEIPPEKKGLGYGGTGLGLTIVKLITETIGTTIRFVEPFGKYNTAFSIKWREGV